MAMGPVETLALWPDGAPTDLGPVPPEASYRAAGGIADGSMVLRNVSEPRIEVFPPDRSTARDVGVVVAPGGGWSINMWEHEGLAVARWLNELGCTAFVLAYRVRATPADPEEFAAAAVRVDGVLARPMGSADKPRLIGDLGGGRRYEAARAAAADDGRRALELARGHAPRFGIDPAAIGMLGFSAGAFLVVDVALDPRGAPPPAFVGAIYGGEVGPDAHVAADAPPLFAAAAGDDVLVKVVEGLHAAWSGADRPSELHVFARGGHGFGALEQGAPSDQWKALFATWLRDLPAG